MVRVPQYLDTRSRGWVPQPDGMVPSATGQVLPIWTPCDPLQYLAVSAQHPGRSPIGYIPDGYQRIGASAGDLGAIWTPV